MKSKEEIEAKIKANTLLINEIENNLVSRMKLSSELSKLKNENKLLEWVLT